MSILDLHTDDTVAAMPARVNVPKPEPKFSVWTVIDAATGPVRGVTAGWTEISASALERLEPFGATMGRMAGETPEAGFGRRMADEVRTGVREGLAPDAQTASAAEQVLYGFARGASKVVLGATAGPAGFALAGAEEATTAARELQRQGVDDASAWKAGAVQGAGLALAALPLAGTTLKSTAALYLAGGPGGFVAQQALTREILKQGGYDQIADGYDPFDPVGLAVSALIPAVFTAAAVRGQRRAATVSREAEDAARVLLQVEQRQGSEPPAGAARAAEGHDVALTNAEAAVARGEPVHVRETGGTPAFETLESFLASSRITPESLPPAAQGDFYAWVRQNGGIDIGQKLDITGDANNVRANPAGIFRQGGNATDTLAEMAIQAGYLRPGASSGDFVDLVQAAARGERVLTFDQQMAAAARTEAEASLQARLEAVEGRLQLLGVDPAPARGNVAALEAYARQHEPAILRAALDEARAVEDMSLEFEALQRRAEGIARDIEDGGRTLADYEREIAPLSPTMRRLVEEAMSPARAVDEAAAPVAPDVAARSEPAAGAEAAATPGANAEKGAAAARLAQVRQQFPDLQVQLDGMDKPMALDDFMAAVKAEADELAADGPLMQVAAECALLLGNG